MDIETRIQEQTAQLEAQWAQDEREEEPRRPMWELAECTCPELCERDHELD